MSQPLPVWQRRLFGVLPIAGASLGLVLVATQLLNSPLSWLNGLFLAFFAAFYLYGVVAGVALLEGREDSLLPSICFWAIQIPLLQTSVFGFAVASGGMLQVYLQWEPWKLGLNYSLGSFLSFSLFQPERPGMIGLNLFALAVTLVLLTASRRQLPPTSLQATAATPVPAP